ncbi:MAG: PD-(D/E)XK motif protein, partial [Dehalococcoidia bacterium]|nr:PD-(D/E)XK motif protein [Dehalococcoidia bacterium]
WGELWVLREIVAPVKGLCNAVGGWRGPLGTDQDFQLGGTCIEVKTSTAAKFDKIQISSERQLEVPVNVTLLLVALSLDARAGHGQSLVEMVRSARCAAAQCGCLHTLDDRLESSGYADEDADLYEDTGYAVRSFHPFTIDQGFPRLVSGDLLDGVSEVSYSVSTSFCDQYRITVQQPDQLLEGMA